MTQATSTSAAQAGQQSVAHGMLLMIAGMLILPGIDAIAKFLSDTVQSGQVAWARFMFQILILAPFVLWRGGLTFDYRLWAHAARGFLIALATVLFFTSLKVMPLADAIAVFFIQPFIVTLLAAVLLGEIFGWRRMLAIAVGFAGSLLIIKPSYELFGVTALLPVGAACAFSFYVILTRWLAHSETALNIQFLTGVSGCVTMSIALFIGAELQLEPLVPTWPTSTEWALLALLGLIATSGHYLVVMAFHRASVAILAPFQYLEIISATTLGLIIFGDFPDPLTWVGIAVIVGSGLYVFYRERKLAQ